MASIMATWVRCQEPIVVPLVPTHIHVDADGRVVNQNAMMHEHVEAQRSEIRPGSIKHVYDNNKK
eukprot:scaffold421327_cov73-Attheya_sp.AAC.1